MASANKRMKFLLPIKTSKGLVLQAREEVDEDREETEPPDNDAAVDDVRPFEVDTVGDEDEEGAVDQSSEGQTAVLYGDAEFEKLSAVEQLAYEEAQAKEMKICMANYAQGIVDNPQQNVRNLRHLRMMLANPLCRARPVLADCIAVSLCEVFKDILPSYRIRVATDAEKSQMAKKETKRLRAFEESLLLNYRKYLGLLRAAMRGPGPASGDAKGKKQQLKRQKWQRRNGREAEVVFTNRSLAIRCLAQLLGAHPSFNESEELIDWLAPCLNSRSRVDSASAFGAFRQLFADDLAGEATLRAVKSVCRYAGGLAPNKVHAELLEVLASVRLDLPPPPSRAAAGDNGSFASMTHQQKLARLSRQQRRQGKRSAGEVRDLSELRAQESGAVRARRQQRCAELLLHLYVRVLRARPLGAGPLAAALAGLNRLALRVNLDLLPDLFAGLGALLDWPDLAAENSLMVVQTALSLLTGEGESLTLDPRRFYLHLYGRLDRLVRCHPELAPRLSDTLRLALADRRRHLPPARPVSFLRRLIDSCCCPQAGNAAALTELLSCAARLFAVFPRAHHLLEPADTEDDPHGGGGGGHCSLTPPAAFDAAAADPDLCPSGAAVTCQPALRRLSLDHPSAAVRQLAARLLRLDFVVPSRYREAELPLEGGDVTAAALADDGKLRKKPQWQQKKKKLKFGRKPKRRL